MKEKKTPPSIWLVSSLRVPETGCWFSLRVGTLGYGEQKGGSRVSRITKNIFLIISSRLSRRQVVLLVGVSVCYAYVRVCLYVCMVRVFRVSTEMCVNSFFLALPHTDP